MFDGTSRIIATEIKGKHYALVTSFDGNSMQVIDVTDPARPKAAGLAVHGEDGFTELEHSLGIATAEIEGRHYALVTASDGDGLQIIDITNPYSLSAVSALGAPLDYPTGVDVMQIDGHHYALVSNTRTGHGSSQIDVINVTDPSDPSIVAVIDSTLNSGYGSVLEPPSMPAVQVAGRHYAIIPGNLHDNLAVVDLTDPSSPSNAFLPHLRLDLGEGRSYGSCHLRQAEEWRAHPGIPVRHRTRRPHAGSVLRRARRPADGQDRPIECRRHPAPPGQCCQNRARLTR